MGMASPTPEKAPFPEGSAMAVLMPISFPRESSSGPPELPGLIAASTWMTLRMGKPGAAACCLGRRLVSTCECDQEVQGSSGGGRRRSREAQRSKRSQAAGSEPEASTHTLTRLALYLTVQPADEAGGERVVQAEGVADRENALPHQQVRRVAQLYGP